MRVRPRPGSFRDGTACRRDCRARRSPSPAGRNRRWPAGGRGRRLLGDRRMWTKRRGGLLAIGILSNIACRGHEAERVPPMCGTFRSGPARCARPRRYPAETPGDGLLAAFGRHQCMRRRCRGTAHRPRDPLFEGGAMPGTASEAGAAIAKAPTPAGRCDRRGALRRHRRLTRMRARSPLQRAARSKALAAECSCPSRSR